MWSFVLIRNPSRVGVAFRLNFLRALVRWITSYFSGAHTAPWVAAQCVQLRWISSRILQFRSVDELYVRMLMSSTKPLPETRDASFSTVSSRSLIKKRKRIGDIGDP